MKHCVLPKKFALLLAMACLLASGCTRDKNGAAADAGQSPPGSAASEVTQETQDGERTWVGLLPCSDWGIDTRLVLRSRGGQRDYLLTETLSAAGAEHGREGRGRSHPAMASRSACGREAGQRFPATRWGAGIARERRAPRPNRPTACSGCDAGFARIQATGQTGAAQGGCS
jgi:hypothetical protein